MQLHLSLFWFFFLGVCAVNCTEYEGCNHTCLVTNDMSERCMYQKIGQKCYYQFSNNLTWLGNRQWCIDQGLEMVRLSRDSIPDIAQLHFNYPVETTPIKWRYMWLAGKGVSLTDWTFINDTLVLHTSMVVDGSVYGNGLLYCGYLDTESISLKTYRCDHKMKFLCRNGNNLTAFRSNATWFQAREKCLLLGGDLFYLRDETKEMPYEHITDLIKSAMNNSQIPVGEALHIGVHRLSWQWPNGDPIASSNWYSRMPTVNDFGYNCLAIDGGGSWRSHICDKEYRAFCQNIPLETEDTRGDVVGGTTYPVVQLDPVSLTPETNNVSGDSEKDMETQQKKNAETQQNNNVEIQQNFLNELIVAGTLAAVFFLGCLILAAILIFISRKIGLKREEDHRQATRRDTDTYDHINPAAPHYLHATAPPTHESQDQPRQDEQEPRSEGYSYTYVEPEAEARPSARHQYLEMM